MKILQIIWFKSYPDLMIILHVCFYDTAQIQITAGKSYIPAVHFLVSALLLSFGIQKIGACGKTTKIRTAYLPLKRN